jgi:hypothetical protein
MIAILDGIERYHSRAEIAVLLTSVGFKISAKTLARKAWEGRGPAYVLFGGRALYRLSVALEWAHGSLKLPPNSPSF